MATKNNRRQAGETWRNWEGLKTPSNVENLGPLLSYWEVPSLNTEDLGLYHLELILPVLRNFTHTS